MIWFTFLVGSILAFAGLWIAELRREGRLLQPVLLLLLEDGPSYGADLADLVERLTGARPRAGVLYPTLRSLERDGLVASCDGEATSERRWRPRRYYHLTGVGRRAVLEGRHLHQEKRENRIA